MNRSGGYSGLQKNEYDCDCCLYSGIDYEDKMHALYSFVYTYYIYGKQFTGILHPTDILFTGSRKKILLFHQVNLSFRKTLKRSY